MKLKIIRLLAFAAMGGLLASLGADVMTIEFWIAMVLMAAVQITSALNS